MSDASRPGVLVVGVGNVLRGDDGAGIEVARRVRECLRSDDIDVRELPGDPTALLDVCLGREAVVLVDTMRSGASPGTIRRLDASTRPLPARERHGPRSTHTAGLADAVELARALGALPARAIVYAVEGRRYDAGAELSDALEAILPTLVERVVREARSLHASHGSLTGFSAS